MTMRHAIGIILALLFAAPAWAQPSGITTASTIQHNASITITGTGFGTKATAAPIKYDDFQSVAVNAQIVTSTAAGPSWGNNTGGGGLNNTHPIASTSNLRSGTPFTRNMRSRWVGCCTPEGTGLDTSNVTLSGQTFVKGLISGWTYMDDTAVNSPFLGAIKIFRFHTTGAGNPNVAMSAANAGLPCLTGGGWTYQVDGSPTNPGFFSGDTAYNLCRRWIYVELLFDLGSGNGTATGSGYAYVDGALMMSFTNTAISAAGVTALQEIYVGNYVNNNFGDWTGTFNQYWESVYIDNSWARVELVDGTSYTGSSHHEPCVPTAWTSTSINCKVVRGSFAEGASVHIAVCTEANACAVSASAFTMAADTGGASGGAVRPRVLRRFRVSLGDQLVPFTLTLAGLPLLWRRRGAVLSPDGDGDASKQRHHEQREPRVAGLLVGRPSGQGHVASRLCSAFPKNDLNVRDVAEALVPPRHQINQPVDRRPQDPARLADVQPIHDDFERLGDIVGLREHVPQRPRKVMRVRDAIRAWVLKVRHPDFESAARSQNARRFPQEVPQVSLMFKPVFDVETVDSGGFQEVPRLRQVGNDILPQGHEIDVDPSGRIVGTATKMNIDGHRATPSKSDAARNRATCGVKSEVTATNGAAMRTPPTAFARHEREPLTALPLLAFCFAVRPRRMGE